MRPVLLATAVTVALLVFVPCAFAAKLPAGVFVGKAGKVAFGVAIDSRSVVAYACDGRRLGAWFKGRVGRRSISSLRAGSRRLRVAAITTRRATGRARALRARFAGRTAVLRRARGKQGLYRSENVQAGRRRLGGWIVLPGGRQVGVLATGSTLSTAPTLSTTSLTAGSLIAGTVVAPADPQAIVLDFDGDGIDASGAVTTTLLGGGSRFVNWTRRGDDDVFVALDSAKLKAQGYTLSVSGRVLARGGITVTRSGVSTTTTDGFHMLRLLDGNGDGILSPADPAFESGLLFRDLNGNGQLGDTTAAGADLIASMTEMNMDFLALQAAVQNENLRFTSLSNASKARRTLALNAIRNLK